MSNRQQTAAANGDLRQSLHDVVNAAEGLLRATVDEANADYRKARAALDARLREAKSHAAEHVHEIASGAKSIGAKSSGVARNHPWITVAVSAGVGLLLGISLRGR